MMGLAGMAEDLAAQRKALAQEKQQRISGGNRREAYICVVGADTVHHAPGKGSDRQTREVVLNELCSLLHDVRRELLALEQVLAMKAPRELAIHARLMLP
jgi:hypothetical protein